MLNLPLLFVPPGNQLLCFSPANSPNPQPAHSGCCSRSAATGCAAAHGSLPSARSDRRPSFRGERCPGRCWAMGSRLRGAGSGVWASAAPRPLPSVPATLQQEPGAPSPSRDGPGPLQQWLVLPCAF